MDFFFRFIFAISVLASAAVADSSENLGPEKVRNGHFSRAFSKGLAEGWSVTGAECGTPSADTVNFASAPAAQKMIIKDNYNLKQDLSLEPGKTYRVSAKIKVLSLMDKKPPVLVINKTVLAEGGSPLPSDSFETLTGVWTQPAGGGPAILYIGPVGECYSGSYTVDDVSCREILNYDKNREKTR